MLDGNVMINLVLAIVFTIDYVVIDIFSNHFSTITVWAVNDILLLIGLVDILQIDIHLIEIYLFKYV